MKGSWRRRCGAWIRPQSWRGHQGGPFCRRWAVPGKARCYLHGGLSTGPKTPEGKAASLAARLEGRRRRIAELALEGKKINTGHNGGRYPKDWPMTPDGKPEKRRNPAPSHKQQLEELRERWAATREARKEQREIRRLLRTIFRGSSSALSANRDEALIAKAKEAIPILRQKLLGPK